MRTLLIILLIRATALSATIGTVAGTGKAGHTGEGGVATEARINGPFGVVKGPQGNLYICDTFNHLVRCVDVRGKITTVAGTGKKGYSGDEGKSIRANLNEPYEVRVGTDGNVYFVEMQNHIVRRVDLKTGKIATIAGTGQRGFSGDGGTAIKAKMNRPHSIQFGPEGNLYICDIGNHRIRKVDLKTGRISTFAGTGERKPTPDGASLSGTPLTSTWTI